MQSIVKKKVTTGHHALVYLLFFTVNTPLTKDEFLRLLMFFCK